MKFTLNTGPMTTQFFAEFSSKNNAHSRPLICLLQCGDGGEICHPLPSPWWQRRRRQSSVHKHTAWRKGDDGFLRIRTVTSCYSDARKWRQAVPVLMTSFPCILIETLSLCYCRTGKQYHAVNSFHFCQIIESNYIYHPTYIWINMIYDIWHQGSVISYWTSG